MSAPSVTAAPAGRLADGRALTRWTLDNGRGLSMQVLDLGGIVSALHWPDRDGRPANLVLGLDDPADPAHAGHHLGTLVGRVANRLAQARVRIDGRDWPLPANDGAHTLHGGPEGFGRRLWQVTPLPPDAAGNVGLALGLTSPDGDQGFPGRLQVRVRYTLTADSAWRIDYEAESDQPTVVSLTHHAYWNLAGAGSATGQRLTLAASRFLPVGPDLIPTGEALPVDGTPFDFRVATPIDARLREAHPQLLAGRGYDHHLVLDDPGPGLRFAAMLHDPASGRAMALHTTAPGLQFYSGNFLDGRPVGHGRRTLRQGDGVCLETQLAPDAANRPHTADGQACLLRPGAVWRSCTEHRFLVLPP